MPIVLGLTTRIYHLCLVNLSAFSTGACIYEAQIMWALNENIKIYSFLITFAVNIAEPFSWKLRRELGVFSIRT